MKLLRERVTRARSGLPRSLAARAVPWAIIALGAGVAACSSAAVPTSTDPSTQGPESTASSTSPLTITGPIPFPVNPVPIVVPPSTIALLSVQPTDTTIAFTFALPGATEGASVVLTGPNGSTTQTSLTSALFTGLAPCTLYTYAVQWNGTTLPGGSGQVNTRYSGTEACPATEVVLADQFWSMIAMEHDASGDRRIPAATRAGLGYRACTCAIVRSAPRPR